MLSASFEAMVRLVQSNMAKVRSPGFRLAVRERPLSMHGRPQRPPGALEAVRPISVGSMVGSKRASPRPCSIAALGSATFRGVAALDEWPRWEDRHRRGVGPRVRLVREFHGSAPSGALGLTRLHGLAVWV
jgi:hypothetical protein